ncbi:MAG: hypothetical protein ACXADW_13565 [Candidatus Hodarchaeales archaeon]|jgi:hypothetical protein
MKEWYCPKCGHEVLASEKPQPIHWTDGHVCYFKIDERYTPLNRKEVRNNARTEQDG